MNSEEFKKYGYQLVDWMSEYLNEKVVDYPVKSQAQPRQIYNQIPDNPPLNGEPFENLFRDFTNIIMPGITHWNSPNFFAYFPCNNSYISILAEMLIVTLGSQCMMWDTSPAAAELEEKVVNWLKDMCGLPKEFAGCIQDTASTCTLISLITAREKVTNYSVNQSGYINQPVFRVYQSTETHSSIEKAVKVMGVGKENLRKIPVDDQFRMIPEELEKAILEDKESGYIPLAVVGAMGTTGSTSCDPLRTIGEICKKYNIWFHVDGALSGSALILPEKSWMSMDLNMQIHMFSIHISGYLQILIVLHILLKILKLL
jgi:aromatic-L-amino-acid decarboxylase